LLAALRRLANRFPGDAARLEVILAGPLTAEEARVFEAPDLVGRLRHVGALARPESLRLQAGSDSLLLVTDGRRTGEISGKLFE
jgi:hypothetical protein